MSKEPIWILHICTRLSIGGVQAFIMNYYKYIDKSKIQFALAVQRNFKYDYDFFVEKMGGRVHYLPDMKDNLLEYSAQLNSLLRVHPEYQIIHNHMNQNNVFPALIGRFNKVPVIISHSHSQYVTDNKIKRITHRIRRTVNTFLSTDYFACSKEAGLSLYGKKKMKEVAIIRNAIETDRYIFDGEFREEIRSNLNISDKLVIGHVGNFTPPKNYGFIITLLKEVIEINPNIVMLFVGEGDLFNEVNKKVHREGLADSIVFLGQRKDVPKLYSVMDLLILPSTTEGLGMVAIEGQISGLEILASENVPSEVDITGNVKFLSLNNEVAWRDHILRKVTTSRNFKNEAPKDCNMYEISICAPYLQTKYIELMNEKNVRSY